MKIIELTPEIMDQLFDYQNQTAECNTESPVMLPPLQQKIELLKKATGVHGYYDTDDYHNQSYDNIPDELAPILKNAGLVAIQIASDDNDLGM